MKNFPKKLEEATEAEMQSWVNELDFNVIPLASDELTRRGIKRLNESIDKNTDELIKFAEASDRSSRVAEKFTAALFILALVQLLVGLLQLLLSMFNQNTTQYKSLTIFSILAALGVLIYFFRMISLEDK